MENSYQNQSGGSNVPPPPPPPVSIRTMGSDANSIQQSGGGRPVPQIVNPPSDTRTPSTPTTPSPAADVKIGVPGYEGLEEKIFEPQTIPTGTQPAEDNSTGLNSKKIIVIVLSLAIIIGLGGVGYFLVYPLLFPSSPAAVAPAPITEPITEPAPATIIHRSFITAKANVPVPSLAQATPEVIATGSPAILKEVPLTNASGTQMAFSKYLPTLITDFTEAELGIVFEDDFTAFVYYSGADVWPGYVAKVKSGVSVLTAQTTIDKLKNSGSIGNLFPQSPGDKSSLGFKTGTVSGQPAQYITFARKDAALSYAWFGNYLLISTNYAGAQEAAKNLIAQ